MFHRPSTGQGAHAARRGQALVEFALILPLLVLLLLMALDFGRVFFGWVALHNAARIGADYAAANAYAWDGDPGPYAAQRSRYQELILNDLQSLNCTLPSPDPVPDPDFDGYADGELVHVQLDCSFGLLTPLAESILGGPVPISVQTDFPVHRTIVGGIPAGGPPPPTCNPGELRVPDLVDQHLEDAFAVWDASDFTGPFDPVVQPSIKKHNVDDQNPEAGTCAPVDSGMTVDHS